eukprot:TRINITY_DN2860_c0_g1_i1.p1 TRINITY_DN2860_c0_g1~~TRINITY_DN2860_c0_g1_i1.p1  ORF type:complete len:347 (+),score=50.27 TRINITY_DN2860_c0_g1_i1:1847-2887(+)
MSLPIVISAVLGYSLVYPSGSWEKAKAEDVGMSSSILDNKMSPLPGGIFVTRYGRSVWERDPSESRSIWSISKSIVSLAYCKVQTSGTWGKLPDNVPYSDSPTSADNHYGVEWFSGGDPGTVGKYYTFNDIFSMSSSFGLKPLPNDHPSCAYNNNGIQLAGYAILEKMGMTPDNEMALPITLFDDVGSQDSITFKGQMSGYQGGYSVSGRDLARLGLLVLSNGTWSGKEILDPKWVALATSSQVPATTTPNTDRSNEKLWNEYDLSQSLPFNGSGHVRMSGDLGYGYTFWLLPNSSAVHMSGLYGNYVIIDFKYGLVISVTNNQSQHPGASVYHRAVLSSIVQPNQ